MLGGVLLIGGCERQSMSQETPREMMSDSPAVETVVSETRELETERQATVIQQSKQITDLWGGGDYDQAASAFADWLEQDAIAALTFLNEAQAPLIPAHFGPAIQGYLEKLPREEAMALALRLEVDHRLQESVAADVAAAWVTEDRATALAWMTEHGGVAFVENIGRRLGGLGSFGPAPEALAALRAPIVGLPLASGAAVILYWLVRAIRALVRAFR